MGIFKASNEPTQAPVDKSQMEFAEDLEATSKSDASRIERVELTPEDVRVTACNLDT